MYDSWDGILWMNRMGVLSCDLMFVIYDGG